MTDFVQTILQEISTLPKSRHPDVLAFIRYLKLSVPDDEMELEKRFEQSLKSIRARVATMGITPEDIEAEIRAVRDEHASRD
jgi:hypothetical protein